MAYSHTTRGVFRAQLSARLGDAENVFWTADELNAVIDEALRTWNAATGYFRARGAFQTSAGAPFYDLSTVLRDGPLLLARTLTDRDLILSIERDLLEPVTTDWSAAWRGTDQFTLDDITRAVERRRDEFLRVTGQIVSTSKQTVPASDGRVSIPDSVIDVRRAAWIALDDDGAESAVSNLWRVSDFTLNTGSVGWSLSPGTPDSYSVFNLPNTQLQLAPPNRDVGNLHLLTVNAGATLDPSTGVVLGVAEDFAWVVKRGAEADLLSKDGAACDPARAAYCESRWEEGLRLASIAASASYCEVNGLPAPVSSLFDLDSQVPGWQGSTGTPETLCLSGLHAAGLYPVPDDAYSIVCDTVRNAVVPASDADQIQVGRELLDVIIGECIHLSLFKCGGDEFKATAPLHDAFMDAAAEFNSRLRAQIESEAERDKSQREERQRSRAA